MTYPDPLHVDPQTKYLQADRINAFDAVRKARFIELAHDIAAKGNYPDIVELCNIVGIQQRTYYKHMELDETFKADWMMAMRRIENELVKTMVARGKTPGGYLDRITWLRKHFKEWNPEANVQFTHNNSSDKRVIDAIIVDSTPQISQEIGITNAQQSESKQIENTVQSSAKNDEVK